MKNWKGMKIEKKIEKSKKKSKNREKKSEKIGKYRKIKKIGKKSKNRKNKSKNRKKKSKNRKKVEKSKKNQNLVHFFRVIYPSTRHMSNLHYILNSDNIFISKLNRQFITNLMSNH